MTEQLWVPPYEYSTAGGSWGMHVEWLDYKVGRVWGHHLRIPKPGDILRSNLQSGRVGIFRFINVEQQTDPDDMFFGTVEAVGYEDELDMPSLFNEPLAREADDAS